MIALNIDPSTAVPPQTGVARLRGQQGDAPVESFSLALDTAGVMRKASNANGDVVPSADADVMPEADLLAQSPELPQGAQTQETSVLSMIGQGATLAKSSAQIHHDPQTTTTEPALAEEAPLQGAVPEAASKPVVMPAIIAPEVVANDTMQRGPATPDRAAKPQQARIAKAGSEEITPTEPKAPEQEVAETAVFVAALAPGATALVAGASALSSQVDTSAKYASAPGHLNPTASGGSRQTLEPLQLSTTPDAQPKTQAVDTPSVEAALPDVGLAAPKDALPRPDGAADLQSPGLAAPQDASAVSGTGMPSQSAAPRPRPDIDMTGTSWPTDIADEINAALQLGEGEIELKMTPAHLGTLRIRLEIEDGRVGVIILSETPEVARLFNDNQHRLSEQLQRGGMDLAQHQSQSGGQSSAGGQGQGQGHGARIPWPQAGPTSPDTTEQGTTVPLGARAYATEIDRIA